MFKKNLFDAQLPRVKKSVDNIFGNFLINKGLYEEIEITKENIYELADLVGGHVKIDIYCPKCKANRVFSCEEIPYYWYDESRQEIVKHSLEEQIEIWQQIGNSRGFHTEDDQEKPWTWTSNDMKNSTRLMVFKFCCAMDSEHHLDYVVVTQGNIMKKIGQYPSVADLTLPELNDYRKVMSKEDEKELRRAIGLHAAGIGIGSFVYLRRIFERIMESASNNAIMDGKIKEEEYVKARVNEKVKMLSDYLPSVLVDNSVFYGIISKGIHELSEEECLEFFPVMKSFIMMILREWEKARKDKEEEKAIRASLNAIATKIK